MNILRLAIAAATVLTASLGASAQKAAVKINIIGWATTNINAGVEFGVGRNLGADSNLPYITTYAGFKGNEGAIGAYFKISREKSSSVDSPKYETHANIWTSTLLSGNQGFDPALSPEFGYWYLYLNVYGRSTNFSQMRFANGSGGMAPTDDSVYKFMPIRLIW